MVDKEKSNHSSVSIEGIINWFKKYSFVGTILTIILTAFITAFITSKFNYSTNQRLSMEEYNRSIRDRQMDNIAESVKQVSKIEQLRKKIYWAKVYDQLSLLMGVNDEFDDDIKQLDNYRVQYEEASADFSAAFHLSCLLFDLDIDKTMELYDKFNEKIAFGYDSDAITNKWVQLKEKEKNDTEIIDEIFEYAEERYSDDFFYLGMKYAFDLTDKVRD